MTGYQETLDWMFSRLPMFQRQGASAYRKDLTNIRLLANHLKHPEQHLKCIHVAGTNGKGSTSHMLASILMESGYHVGLYTSPHLKDFRERITIDGQKISEEFVVDFIKTHKSFFEEHDLSFFEMTVGMAFDYFASKSIDVAVIETGMGGRLDATNIIIPIISVITNIGMDHMQFLGNTLADIAREKAGIIKENVPVIIGETSPETKAVFERVAADLNAPISFASEIPFELFETDLKGNYQRKNQRTVLASVDALKTKGWIVPNEAIKSGLKNVVRNTNLHGRWQKIHENPIVICDTAHNSHGLKSVLPQIQEYKYEKLHIVLGLVSDKDPDEILALFPKNALYYFCRPNIPRGMDVAILVAGAKKAGLIGKSYDSVNQAYEAALQDAAKNDFIYVGGSTFVVAEIL